MVWRVFHNFKLVLDHNQPRFYINFADAKFVFFFLWVKCDSCPERETHIQNFISTPRSERPSRFFLQLILFSLSDAGLLAVSVRLFIP